MVEIVTVRKSFSETLNEIKELEQQKKELIPKIIAEEEEEIKIITMEFGEAMSELRRINLIKRLTKK